MAEGIIALAQTYFYTIIVGIVILLIGFGAGILAKKLVFRILKEIELNKIMSRVGVRYDLEKWVSSIISYVLYLFTIVIFFDQLGITSVVLYLVVGGILMLIILTFLVGLKDFKLNRKLGILTNTLNFFKDKEKDIGEYVFIGFLMALKY